MHDVCPGAHWPVQAPLMQVWLTHAAGLPQEPPALHVWTPLPEHCVVVGLHATQVLLRHAGVCPPHVVTVDQVPVVSHCSMLLPRHSVWPGAQAP